MILPELPFKFKDEREVQIFYSFALMSFLNCPFVAKYRTDGIYNSKKYNIKILVEYKCEANHGKNLSNSEFLARCIIQILCYIKKMEG